MNKREIALCNELCGLMGHKTWRKCGQRCTGSWHGTTDYFLAFEDGTRIFISNGMGGFEQSLLQNIENMKRFADKDSRDKILDVLKRQQEIDNATADKMGMQKYEVVDIVQTPADKYGFIVTDFLAKIKVGGEFYLVCETSFRYSLNKGAEALQSHFDRNNKLGVFTAACIDNPTFVLANVLHSTSPQLYVRSA